jgi:hypothetical protein
MGKGQRKEERPMSKNREFVSASGTANDVFQKLALEIYALGGNDENVRRIISDGDLRRRMAALTIDTAGSSVRTLAEMVKACGLDSRNVNSDITEEHFPVSPELFTSEGSKVFHFGRAMTTAQVEAAIRAEGYEPDPIEKLLAYGQDHPDEQRLYPIVALGSSWVDRYGDRGVPCLYEGDGQRGLSLGWGGPEGRWFGYCRFLASRKSST